MKENSKKKRIVLLDSHAIIHRAYHAMPDFMSSKGEPTGGIFGLCTMLLKILKDLKPDYVIAAFDLPKPTYRHEVYKDYKAGRKKSDNELVIQLKRSRDFFQAFGIPIYDKEGFEADDILGTIPEILKNDKNTEIIIASGDMDTLQLVRGETVKVYTLRKGINDTVMYDQKAVIDRFGFGPELIPDYKGLRGDPSDNIIGISGIGEKTASILIQNFGSIENIYKTLEKDGNKPFEKAGIKPRIIELLINGKEEAIFSKTLATIRRDVPIDFMVPDKTWKEGLDLNRLDGFFAEMEFRTMGNRVRDVLGVENMPKNVDDASSLAEKASEENIDKNILKETSIALWLLDSNKNKANLEDIFAWTGAKSFDEAREMIFKQIEERGLTRVWQEIEKPLMAVIEKMENRGVLIDLNKLNELSGEYHKELSSLERKIWQEAGVEFNINSPKQIGEILFDKMGLKVKNAKKTASGARSTKESELQKLAEEYSIAKDILDHRELQKLLSTYIDVIPQKTDRDGRLHADFLQDGTTTGRMSSESPNLQNIPIKSDLGRRIRDAFTAPRGFVLASFDYSQVELRIAAFLSKDQKLIDIFRSGGDIHTAVASEVFGVPKEMVDKEMRRKAKVINFGIIYGMGVSALKQNLGTTRDEAQKFYNDYFEKFNGLASYLDSVKDFALKNGYTETYFGRRRYFEGIKSKIPFIKAMAERMAINAPIQGTEADIVKLAMVKVNQYLDSKNKNDDAYLILQVHDELVYEIKEEKAEEISKEIQKIMENIIDPKDIYGVKCKVDFHFGKNWGECK